MRTRAVTNVLMAIVACAAAVPAAAQSTPAMNVSAGYSYLYEAGTDGAPENVYDKGWVVSVAQRIGASRTAIVGEAGGSYRTNDVGERQALYGFLGGVRIPLVRVSRASTFAQALTGLEHFRQPGFNQLGMAFQPGAGLDVPMWWGLGLRVQGDFRIAREEGVYFKEGRATVSVVFGMR